LENGELSKELLNKWASLFEVIGNPTRLGILLVLYGSEFLTSDGVHSLTFGQVKDIMEIPSEQSLEYHLKRLTDAKLIDKEPYKDPKGRVYPIYHVTQKWRDFIRETGLVKSLTNFVEDNLLK